jgi:hypothetical protein
MAGMLWVSDREPGVRQLFAELLPDADVLDPSDLHARLSLGQRPDAMVIDGTQLLELPARQRSAVLELPRVLVCTGIMLSSLPMDLVSGGPGVAVLAKPFCVEDLEAAVEWLRGMPGAPMPSPLPFAALVQRRRPRRPGGRLPAR